MKNSAFTPAQVSNMMDQTTWTSKVLWYDVPEYIAIANWAVEMGYMIRISHTQIQWTQTGVEWVNAPAPEPTRNEIIETLTGMVSDHNQISQHQFEMVGKAIEILKTEPTPEKTFFIMQNTSSDKTGIVGTVTAADIEMAVQKVRDNLKGNGFVIETDEMFDETVYFFAWFRDCGDDQKVMDLYPKSEPLWSEESIKFGCQYWTVIPSDKIVTFNI